MTGGLLRCAERELEVVFPGPLEDTYARSIGTFKIFGRIVNQVMAGAMQ